MGDSWPPVAYLCHQGHLVTATEAQTYGHCSKYLGNDWWCEAELLRLSECPAAVQSAALIGGPDEAHVAMVDLGLIEPCAKIWCDHCRWVRAVRKPDS